MIKFLIQHASTLEEKDAGLTEEDMPTDAEVGTHFDSIHLERSRVTQSFMSDLQGFE